MRNIFLAGVLAVLVVGTVSVAQSQSAPSQNPAGANQAPPTSVPGTESSSRDTRIDIAPPKNDAKDHPASTTTPNTHNDMGDPNDDLSGGVQEVHPFNPLRAVRDNDVGDYYYKRGNYKGALARYQDALAFKDNDAAAHYGMAKCYLKLNDPAQAAVHFREYLRILPNGPLSKDAEKALKKLPIANNAATAKNPQS
jgi:tetratricopeptide (TPR) repeat protein